MAASCLTFFCFESVEGKKKYQRGEFFLEFCVLCFDFLSKTAPLKEELEGQEP